MSIYGTVVQILYVSGKFVAIFDVNLKNKLVMLKARDEKDVSYNSWKDVMRIGAGLAVANH